MCRGVAWYEADVEQKIDNWNRRFSSFSKDLKFNIPNHLIHIGTWNCAPTWYFGEYTLGILSRECIANFPLGNNLCAFSTFYFHQGKFFLCKFFVSVRRGLSILFPFYLFIYSVWWKSTRGLYVSLEGCKQGAMTYLLSNSPKTWNWSWFLWCWSCPYKIEIGLFVWHLL